MIQKNNALFFNEWYVSDYNHLYFDEVVDIWDDLENHDKHSIK